jgi:hypothetical protein
VSGLDKPVLGLFNASNMSLDKPSRRHGGGRGILPVNGVIDETDINGILTSFAG